jgi:phosphoserine phosphatase
MSAQRLPPLARSDWAPFDLVIFDCDSTLVDVEGIDELARWLGREEEVAALTNQAMNGEVPLEDVYGRRLAMLRPTRDHLRRLGQLYRQRLLPGADAVLAALMGLGRQVYIVSGGLAEAVTDFGLAMGLPAGHIHAVNMAYDQLSGNWWETWKHPRGRNLAERYLDHDGGPLTVGRGKAAIIQRLRAGQRGRALLIGDGTSDLEASVAVDLFVGFGGVVARDKVRAAAEVFMPASSLAPLLPMAIARPSVRAEYAALYQDGVERLRAGEVVFQNPHAREGLLRRLGG